MKLRNKVALITGGSRGIGKEIAKTFSKEGASLALNYNWPRTELGEMALVDDVHGASGTEVILIQADVAKVSELAAMVDKVVAYFGRIDILVNNAGILLRTDFLTSTEENWDSTFDANLKSVYFLSQLVAKHMIAQKSGKIINIASQSGLAAMDSNIDYGCSKNGVMYLTRSLARVLAPYNINVNCISPGRVSTEMTGYDKDPIKKAKRESEIPLGRISTPDDIAAAALMFASDEFRNVTGQIFAVDGGGILGSPKK